MLKVLKNLKQSCVKVLVIVALLCLQAACDLELLVLKIQVYTYYAGKFIYLFN